MKAFLIKEEMCIVCPICKSEEWQKQFVTEETYSAGEKKTYISLECSRCSHIATFRDKWDSQIKGNSIRFST